MLSGMTEIPRVIIGDYILEFELGPPNAEMQEVARKELRETPEVQKEAMARLRELLKGRHFSMVRCSIKKSIKYQEKLHGKL